MKETLTDQKSKIKVRRAGENDRSAILTILEDTGFFRPCELIIAQEVFDDAVSKGPQGDYQSFVALLESEPVGWICFGSIPCTEGAFDIYWIVVDQNKQRFGIGSALMKFATDIITNLGARIIVAETSGTSRYIPTQNFYEKVGFEQAARIKDFYDSGDDKIIYVKYL